MKEVWKIHGAIMYRILRLNKLTAIFLILLSSFFVKAGMAQNMKKTENVKFLFAKENKATRIYLYPARISLLELPCTITKALQGSPNDIKLEIDTNSKELILLLKKWHSQASNLILKCDDKLFLFNLIPSKNKHYDYVKVLAHIPTRPLQLKSPLPQSPSLLKSRGFEKEDFKIKKVLDHSWELKK